MTKESGYELLLAESTFSCLTDSHDGLTFVAELDVRGRERKVRVWSLQSARIPT